MERNTSIFKFRSFLLALLVLFAAVGNGFDFKEKVSSQKIETIKSIDAPIDHDKQDDNEDDTNLVISETVLVNNISSGSSLISITKNVYKLFGFVIPVVRDFKPNIISIPTSLLEYYIVLTQYIIAPHAP